MAILSYLAAAFRIGINLLRGSTIGSAKVHMLVLGLIAVSLHGIILYQAIITGTGLNLGIFNAASLVTWLIAELPAPHRDPGHVASVVHGIVSRPPYARPGPSFVERARQFVLEHLARLLAAVGLAGSGSEGRRLIEQGGVRLNGEQLADPALELGVEELVGSVLSVGRRRFVRLVPPGPG